MDRLDSLYQDAENNGILIAAGPLKCESMIVDDKGDVSIALNAGSLTSRQYELYLVAHEMAHFHTGTYYKLYSPLQLRCQMEWRADTRMVCDLVPIEDLRDAIHRGYTEPWELADYFDVPEKVILRADEIYHAKNLL